MSIWWLLPAGKSTQEIILLLDSFAKEFMGNGNVLLLFALKTYRLNRDGKYSQVSQQWLNHGLETTVTPKVGNFTPTTRPPRFRGSWVGAFSHPPQPTLDE